VLNKSHRDELNTHVIPFTSLLLSLMIFKINVIEDGFPYSLKMLTNQKVRTVTLCVIYFQKMLI